MKPLQTTEIVKIGTWVQSHWAILALLVSLLSFAGTHLWSAYGIKFKYDQACEKIIKHEEMLLKHSEEISLLTQLIKKHDHNIERLENIHFK